MATCIVNSPIADAFIVTLYPEVASIVALMDSLAAVGRQVYVLTLDDQDHAAAINTALTADLAGNGYSVTTGNLIVTIACA